MALKTLRDRLTLNRAAIRRWTAEVGDFLSAPAARPRAGEEAQYTESDLKVLEEVQKLRTQKLEFEEIRAKLRQLGFTEKPARPVEKVEVEEAVKIPRAREERTPASPEPEPKKPSGDKDWYELRDILGSETKVQIAQKILGNELSEDARKKLKMGAEDEKTVVPVFNIRDIWLMRRVDQLATPTTSEADYPRIREEVIKNNEFLNVILERLEQATNKTRTQWGLNQVAQAMEVKVKDLKELIKTQNINVPKGPKGQWLIDIPTFSEIYLQWQWLGQRTRERALADRKAKVEVREPEPPAAAPTFSGLAE